MKVDPESALEAQNRYSCFDHMAVDPQMYGYLANNKVKKSCIDEVITQFRNIQHNAFKYMHKDGIEAEEEYFFCGSKCSYCQKC